MNKEDIKILFLVTIAIYLFMVATFGDLGYMFATVFMATLLVMGGVAEWTLKKMKSVKR